MQIPKSGRISAIFCPVGPWNFMDDLDKIGHLDDLDKIGHLLNVTSSFVHHFVFICEYKL